MSPSQPSDTAMEAARKASKCFGFVQDEPDLLRATDKAAIEIQVTYAPLVELGNVIVQNAKTHGIYNEPRGDFRLIDVHLIDHLEAVLALATPKGAPDGIPI